MFTISIILAALPTSPAGQSLYFKNLIGRFPHPCTLKTSFICLRQDRFLFHPGTNCAWQKKPSFREPGGKAMWDRHCHQCVPLSPSLQAQHVQTGGQIYYLKRRKSSPLPGSSCCSPHISPCLRLLKLPTSRHWTVADSLRLGLPESAPLWIQSPVRKVTASDGSCFSKYGGRNMGAMVPHHRVC